VDAGELKENADFKLRAIFRQFADNPQCKHIFFAAMHDVGYISELLPYISNRDRFTLVKTYSAHPEFKKLGFHTEELRGVFRNTPLPTEGQTPHKTTGPQSPSGHTSKNSQDQTTGPNICQYYPKGSCRYGKTCNNIHVRSGNFNGIADDYSNTSDVNESRSGSISANTRPPVPIFQKHSFMGAAGSKFDDDFAAMLPKEDKVAPNRIPVNMFKYRLDACIPPPSPAALSQFNSRTAIRKLCNNAHLKGHCPHETCQYDHCPISEEVRSCLKQVARSMPCPKRGACRASNCIQGLSTLSFDLRRSSKLIEITGHICQRPDCRHRGGKAYCKLGAQAHVQTLHVVAFVRARTSHDGAEDNDGDGGSVNDKASSYGESGDDDAGAYLVGAADGNHAEED
jgi:hypothetical protein